ncbi:hypothetical protein PHMEG_00015970 [Phytophthora megakarya]|uniref:Uncharacterized protein n=1 Tax=Phytophthora megakarya TaxID=4795 RepID=A0A225VZY6_9STRA|nr:hypothetical protein PHMEG_00015970 [Phytophthora megakarya]
MAPPIVSIGAFAPVSFLDWLTLLCLPCAQDKQFRRSLIVILIPDPASSVMRSTVSHPKCLSLLWSSSSVVSVTASSSS